MLTFNDLQEHLDELWAIQKGNQDWQEVEDNYKKVIELTTKIKQLTMTEQEMQEAIDKTQSATVLVELIRNQEVSEKFIRHNEQMMNDFCWFEANMSVRYSERYMKYLLKNEFISWDEVAMFQPITPQFAVKYGTELHIPYLQSNENINSDDWEEKGIWVALKLIQS